MPWDTTPNKPPNTRFVGFWETGLRCSTWYQTCKLLIGKGVSRCNERLGNDLGRRKRWARLFLALALCSTRTRITKRTSMSRMVGVYSFFRLSNHTLPSTAHSHGERIPVGGVPPIGYAPGIQPQISHQTPGSRGSGKLGCA